jgi:hypothetical protein
MEKNISELERLGAAMYVSALSQPNLIGSAISVWEAAHPGQTAANYLKCDESKLWRIAVTPRPTGSQFAERLMELAIDIGLSPLALVNILRFAENAEAFAESSADGEMLMAALDTDNAEGDES